MAAAVTDISAKRRRFFTLRDAAEPEATFPAHAIIASARRVDPSDRRAAAPPRQREVTERLWEMYDSVGEVKFAANFVANVMSKLRLHGATLPAPDSQPVPVDDDSATLPENLRTAVALAVARLDNAEGGQSELLRSYTLNMEVPGECWLYGLDAQPEQRNPQGEVTRPAMPETWMIKSTDELRKEGEVWKLYESGQGQGEQVPDGAFMLRIWQRHPRFSLLADSFLRGVLNECVELLLLARTVRASARSRMNAGILLVPSELDFKRQNPDEQGSDDPEPFTEDLTSAMMEPIEDEGDPAGQVPFVVRGKSDYLKPEVFRHIDLGRTVSAEERNQRTELVRRIAQGLNVPPEIVLGMSEANHWTAWQVDRTTFTAHIEPRAVAMCDALTHGFLRPQLLELGFTPEQANSVFVWYDDSEAVSKPNLSEDADQAHDRFAISDEAYRRAKGFDPADAPDPTELANRVGMKRGIMDGPITETLLSYLLQQQFVDAVELIRQNQAAIATTSTDTTGGGTGDVPAPTPPSEGPPTEGTPDQGPTAQAAAALVAGSRRARRPGEVLTQLDRSLADRLHVACEAAMQRALEQAGNRLRSRVQGNAAVAAAIRDTPAADRAAVLGRTLLAGLGIVDDDLFGGDPWAGLADQFQRWVAAAQAQALQLADGWWGPLTDDQRQRYAARQVEDRATAWTWLAGDLDRLAVERLYDPHPSAPPLGEADPDLAVPMGTVRYAMQLAGGAQGLTAAGRARLLFAQGGTRPAGGITTGELLLELAGEQGVGQPQWEWQWGALGAPRHPFDGHLALDGLQFAQWDDPELAVQGADSWLGVGFYTPGDHDGCSCFAEPIFPTFGG